MAVKRNNIKTPDQRIQDQISPYMEDRGKVPNVDDTKREYQRKGDPGRFTVGLQDIDETIFYYFENVIKPTVFLNGQTVKVPILYGSPERWAAVQKDGFYRDKNGKIQTPLIMYKRSSMEKNRNIGNKMDATNPHNIQIFEKKYTQKNVYDRFGLVNNRVPVKEYQGVVIPDYYNLEYNCVVFTDYMEHMNKIVEAIGYASDSYWGDPMRFMFKAMIDNYTVNVEMNQGEDRAVKTAFNIKMLGYIIPDSVNAQLQGSLKYYSKAAVKFNIETTGGTEIFHVPRRDLLP